jgi:predicted RNase H-like nuclease (RuvC/YqgF family)
MVDDKEPLEEKLPISSLIRGTSNQTPVTEDTPHRVGNNVMIQALNRQVNRLQQEKRALREENESLLALTIHQKSDIEQLTDQVKHSKLAKQNLTNVERAGLVNVKNHFEEP